MEPERLTLQLLQEITDGFSEERKLGEGGYGVVFKGVRENGEEIAVKMLRRDYSGFDDKQFQKEFYNLKMLQHQNIVRFVGYCYETQHIPFDYNGKQIFADQTFGALCFEYLHNGSLGKHLSNECHGLDWYTRYKIIKGACEGLKYIHQEHMYHLDLKPDNILLDKEMVPKLADFGLSRIVGKEVTNTITQSPLGTLGYMPPEFIDRKIISKEFDIFSLGVVIIQIVAGREGRNKCEYVPSEEFADLVQENWRNMLQATCSGSLLEAYCQQVKKCTLIALNCMEKDRHKRPKIKNIIDELNRIETEVSKSMILKWLNIQPLHLQFPSEPNKSMISCSLHLTNDTDDCVAFQMKNLKESFLGPLCGVVPPRSCYTLAVTMREKLELLPEFFELESAIAGSNELLDFSSYTAVGEHDHFFTKAMQEGREVHKMKLSASYAQIKAMRCFRVKLMLCFITHYYLLVTLIMVDGICACADDLQPASTIMARCYPGRIPVDVHPTELWFLINISRFVHIWNYEKQDMVDYYYTEKSAVQDAKFIAREQWFVTGDHHGSVQVFSYKTKEEIKSFKAHDFAVVCLDIHPTKPYVLSAGRDDLIKLWDWGKGWKCVRTFEMQRLISQLRFNPKDANVFASASANGLQIWNISSYSCEFTLYENESVECFDYITHGDQLYMITVSGDNNARIWDLGSRTCVHLLEGHKDCVCTVCSHPDHPILITGSNDGTVRLWNSITFRLEGILNFGLGMVTTIACLKGTRSFDRN
ncbi:uncharacterized protein [Miscanthus floridulus]|uniref:uncharacterized protein isoform X3 n=1 Tax=Miscanthus floridulus TaxID=154761 RepID=UPI00345B3C77